MTGVTVKPESVGATLPGTAADAIDARGGTEMPYADVNGQRLFYEDTGGGEDAIVFSHGYFMSRAMFDPQIAALRDDWRCISWDERGHGQTETTPEPSIANTLPSATTGAA